jgi:photosystem II stability/assembly factor-like uncharacterized protein
MWIHALLCNSTEIFTGTDGGGIFLSTADLSFWEPVNAGIRNSRITAFAQDGTNVFSATWGNGVFLSSDNGANWFSISAGILNPFITSLQLTGNSLFAGTQGMGVYHSSNNGGSWYSVNNGLDNPYINALSLDDTLLYAATMDGIYHSNDQGNNWSKYTVGLPANQFTSIIANGLNIFTGTQGKGIYYSQDGGNSWNQRNTGLTNLAILSLGRSGTSILAGTQTGMFISDNDGQNWTLVNNALTGNPVSFFYPFNTGIFSGSNINGIVLHEADENEWKQLNEGLTDTSVNTMIIYNEFAYAGTSGNGVWKRPLENIFILNVDPDTLYLSQFSGMKDTLFIHTSMDWTIIGTAPNWMTFEPSGGNGEGYVVFTTLIPNLGAMRKYATFFLYSQTTATISFTIIQKEKTAGIGQNVQNLIRIYPVPSTGIVKIESLQPLKKITIYDAFGKMLREVNNEEQDLILDFSEEGPGVYFLQFEGDGWSAIRKAIIIK